MSVASSNTRYSVRTENPRHPSHIAGVTSNSVTTPPERRETNGRNCLTLIRACILSPDGFYSLYEWNLTHGHGRVRNYRNRFIAWCACVCSDVVWVLEKANHPRNPCSGIESIKDSAICTTSTKRINTPTYLWPSVCSLQGKHETWNPDPCVCVSVWLTTPCDTSVHAQVQSTPRTRLHVA